jgi:hypothetical protein
VEELGGLFQAGILYITSFYNFIGLIGGETTEGRKKPKSRVDQSSQL